MQQEGLFHGFTPAASENQVCLERPRINRLLEKAVEKPAVSVIAGAGYGKTQAVYAFAKRINARTVWMQISGRDNVRDCFWDNFISVISTLNENTAAKLKQMEFPDGDEQFGRFLKILRKDAMPRERYLVVYDDLHLLADRAALGFLENCMAALFPNVSYILISRREPALNMARLTSKNQMAWISGEDLRFSQDEMVSCFRLQHIAPAPQTVPAIYRDTEGWAFAIHIAGLSLKNTSANAAYVPQALRSNTFKLFESEIMVGLSPELRRFLVKLSLMENLDRALLREIGNDSMIKEMEGISSFIRYDSDSGSYHIHRLFLDYLRERQNELSEKEKKEAWKRAAIWCGANNQKLDAINYLHKAGDYDGIAGIFDTLPISLPASTASFLLELLDRMPESVYPDRFMMGMIRVRTFISLGWYGQGRAKLLALVPTLNSLPEDNEKHRLLAVCYFFLGYLGLLLFAETEENDFAHCFKKAAEEARKSGHTVKPPLNGINLGFHVCRVSDPSPETMKRFIDALAESVPWVAEATGGRRLGIYELVQGELAFYKGSLDEAQKGLLLAREKGGKNGHFEIENRALFYLLRIHLCRGDAKGAEGVLKQIEAGMEEHSNYSYSRNFHFDIVTGWYYIQLGMKSRIAPWLRSDYAGSGLDSGSRCLEKLVKARYYLAEKRYPAALASLETRADTEVFLMGRIEMKALEAVIRFRLVDKEGAYTALREACDLAAPQGLFMPFTELGRDIRSLAETAQKENAPGIKQEWLLRIRRSAAIYAKKLYNFTGQAGTGRIRSLSRRETAVLIGLSQGLTREEIAGAGSISPNTVKSVTRNIYNKLGALNHADAVRIATERGIL